MKKLYMAVTADEYELPVAVEESSATLARKMGAKVQTVRKSFSTTPQEPYKSNQSRSPYRWRRVEVED